MLSPEILFAGLVNGLMAGGIYVLVAVGLTLIYGVLHIINFAHGSLLMLAMYAVFFLWRKPLGLDPYVALPIVTAGAFAFGYLLYRAAHRPFQPRQGREHPAHHAGPVDHHRQCRAVLLHGRHADDRRRLRRTDDLARAGAGGSAQARLLRRSAGHLPPARPLHDTHATRARPFAPLPRSGTAPVSSASTWRA